MTRDAILFVMAVFGLALAGVALEWWLRKPAAQVANVCQGCGAKWYPVFHDRDRGPREPITRCPECPMSMAEFEALKAAVRERGQQPKEGEQ